MGEINTIHLRQKISPHQRMGAPQLKRLFRSKYLEGDCFLGFFFPSLLLPLPFLVADLDRADGENDGHDEELQ